MPKIRWQATVWRRTHTHLLRPDALCKLDPYRAFSGIAALYQARKYSWPLFRFHPSRLSRSLGQPRANHRAVLYLESQADAVIFRVSQAMSALGISLRAYTEFCHPLKHRLASSWSTLWKSSKALCCISFCTHHKTRISDWWSCTRDCLSIKRNSQGILSYRQAAGKSPRCSIFLDQHSLLRTNSWHQEENRHIRTFSANLEISRAHPHKSWWEHQVQGKRASSWKFLLTCYRGFWFTFLLNSHFCHSCSSVAYLWFCPHSFPWILFGQ